MALGPLGSFLSSVTSDLESGELAGADGWSAPPPPRDPGSPDAGGLRPFIGYGPSGELQYGAPQYLPGERRVQGSTLLLFGALALFALAASS